MREKLAKRNAFLVRLALDGNIRNMLEYTKSGLIRKQGYCIIRERDDKASFWGFDLLVCLLGEQKAWGQQEGSWREKSVGAIK